MRVVSIIVLLLAAKLGQAAPYFSFSNPPGPHPVGFKAVHQYDYARAYRGEIDAVTGQPAAGERARPVQTLVWYPAKASGKTMVYGDYLRLAGSEDDFTRSEAQAQAYADEVVRNNYGAMSGPEQLREALPGPMRARRDAPPAGGKYPVVIYSPSISAPAFENADLCEYLASHGYVVIASPSVGPRSRDMPDDLEGAETQAADIAFLVGYAHTLPQADARELAVAGYSWGGLANVLAAARDGRIKALVNLDGSVRYHPDLVAASKLITPLSVHVPMLFVAQRPISLEDVARNGKPPASFLNEMKYGDLVKLTMYPMQHFAFSSTYLRFASDDMFNQYPRADVNRAFGWSATYVLRFLDAYLKHDAAARAWLARPPAQNGIPAHAATLETRAAAGMPPGRDALAAELAKRGFEHATETYQAMHAREASFALKEDELIEWGYMLLRAKEPRKAVEIFRLASVLYPASWNAFDSLAEGCRDAGDKAGAIANYRRSLELEPKNDNARQRLVELGAAVNPGA